MSGQTMGQNVGCWLTAAGSIPGIEIDKHTEIPKHAQHPVT